MSYQSRATCPRDPHPGQPLINIPSEEFPGITQHRVFRADALVVQTWLVNPEGDQLEIIDGHVYTSSSPTEMASQSPWVCETCGELAKVKNNPIGVSNV
jgi:hypothetical protein